MSLHSRTTSSTVVAGVLAVAASPLIALRVEIVPLARLGGDTRVAVVVQVAPEDRGRVGRSVVLQGELKRDDRTVASFARVTELAADGSGRIEEAWPPGTYQLRVDIQGAADASGFWVGQVVVPLMAAEEAPPTRSPVVLERPASEPAQRSATTEPPPPPASSPPPPATTPATPARATTPPGAWSEPTADQVDLTVVVTERNQPIRGLTAADLRVEIGGEPAEVVASGDATQAPLWLGLAVDVSRSMAPNMAEVNRQLTRFALRATGGFLLVTGDDTPVLALAPGASPSELAGRLGEIGSAERSDLAGMVGATLAAIEDRGGRRFLIVVTDGGDSSSREDWRQAMDAAGGAGVPVLVIGLRTDDLEERTRHSLERIADDSGGRSYFLGDIGILEMTLDYLGSLVDASVAVRVRRAWDAGQQPRKVRMSAISRQFEVHHPATVR